MKHKLIIISMLTLLMMVGCKSTKMVSKQAVPTKTTTVASEMIDQVSKTEPQFKTANISKMSMAFNVNEREINVSAVCKIKKDSAIFLSIQPFMGIEMFKAEFKPDSVKVFDKMNHKYYVSDYSFFSKRFGVDVDFYSFQALLSARFFCIGKKDAVTDSCRVSKLENGQNQIEYNSGNMVQQTQVSPLNVIQQVLLKAKNSDYQLQTDYKNYTLVNGVSFPQTIALQASSQKSKASCDFSILRVEFNSDLKLTGTNHDRYTLGNIDQLLKK